VTDRPAWTTDEDPGRAARPWFWAVGATVLATAAGVAVVAILSDGPGAPAHHHHHMAMDPPAATQLDVLSPVSISDPAEGNEYAGTMIARGRVRSTELLVDWAVLDGQTVVASGNPTIDTGQGSSSPWSAEVDLSGLAPGRYTFRVSTGNVGYGAEPFTDTRTINVR
jgi:hypothetical protein